MSSKICSKYDICEATLCPLTFNLYSNLINLWYINEPICKLKSMQDNPIILKQKKIVKLKLKHSDTSYLPLFALLVLSKITSHIRLLPDTVILSQYLATKAGKDKYNKAVKLLNNLK